MTSDGGYEDKHLQFSSIQNVDTGKTLQNVTKRAEEYCGKGNGLTIKKKYGMTLKE